MRDQVVHHPTYGRGIVKGQKHRGLDLYVAFDSGRRRWVQVTELRVSSPTPAPKEKPVRIVDTSIQSHQSSPPREAVAAPEEPPPSSPALESVIAPEQVSPYLPARETVAAPEQPPLRLPVREAVIAPEQPRPTPPVTESVTTPEQPLPVIVSPPEQPLAGDSPFHSRRIIEAFRMGVVPDDCVASLTAGRDQELASLQRWLKQDGGSALLVGEYGSGKSHLLRYLYLQALDQHFAVAQVQIDPNETPLHKPKRIYRNVALTLQYRLPGQSMPLSFKDLVRASLKNNALMDHEYLRHLATKTASDARYEDMFWEWIQASEDASKPVCWQENAWGYRYNCLPFVPPIYNHTTSANIICYLLSGLAWAAVHSLGLQGMVILIDEAESMDVSASRSQLERGINFLRGLVRVTNNDEKLLEAPLHSGLVYSGTSIGPRIPFLYKQDCGLRVVFGFTPTPLLDEIPELRSALRVDLEPLDKTALVTVFDWVRQHYERAYATRISEEAIRQSLNTLLRRNGNMRSFTKGCVEVLDDQRYNSPLVEDRCQIIRV